MWPFDNAKIDSLCAIRSRSSAASRTRHGSIEYAGCEIMSAEELTEVVHHDVGAVRSQRIPVTVADAVDPDDPPEVTGAPGLDAGEGVLEHGRGGRSAPQARRAGEERVRCGFPGEVALPRDRAVDAGVEQVTDAGGLEDLGGVRAGRHDRGLQSGGARG